MRVQRAARWQRAGGRGLAGRWRLLALQQGCRRVCCVSAPCVRCTLLLLCGPLLLAQALPVEVYRSREELERMSVGELKRLLLVSGCCC